MGFRGRSTRQSCSRGWRAQQGKQIVLVRVVVSERDADEAVDGATDLPKCGEIYNIYFAAAAQEGICDLDGAPLAAAHR